MRKIRPRSRAVKKSEESQRVLDALDAYLEGNIDDPRVMNALRGIQEEAKSIKLLGNY